MSGRPSLSMAERLSANMKILARCKRAYPELEKSELSQKARIFESEIFEQCTSSDNYQERVESTLDELDSLYHPSEPIETTTDSNIPDVDRPTERIGRYAASYHASGVSSTVYRSVSDTSPSKAIAIKLTTPSLMQAPHNSHREARLLRLAIHETVIPIYSSESIAGGHYIITMPFLPVDFGTLLDRHTLSKAQIKFHLLALFTALEHCHSLGIIHRDVKPSNLLLASPSGPAYLSDFGIAWKAGDPDSEKADEKITDVGTTCYRPPELLFGNSCYGESLDLWAAGCVVAEAERDGRPLFESGEVGTELALIRSIFETLGTPNDDIWPEARTFHDWGKISFKVYPSKDWHELLPVSSSEAKSLVSSLLRYESCERWTANKVVKHPYFNGIKLNI